LRRHNGLVTVELPVAYKLRRTVCVLHSHTVSCQVSAMLFVITINTTQSNSRRPQVN